MINNILKKISNFLQKVFAWIWTSSSDPTKVSLTVKSSLTVGASVLMQVIGITHINLGQTDVNNVVNAITTIVFDATTLIGGIGFFVGLVSKIWSSLSGNNPVISPSTTSQ